MAELQASKVRRRATGTDTVTVACNLPTGHILQIYNVEEVVSYRRDGSAIKENQCTLDLSHGQWALRGPVNRSALAATGRDVELPEDYRMIPGKTPDTGYALTFGIPRDFWERWLKDNHDSPLVKGRHIFAADSEANAVAQAKELRGEASGLQGLNPKGDARVPNGRSFRKFDPKDNKADAEDERAAA